MSVATAVSIVTEIQEISAEILATIGAVDPALADTTGAAEGLIALFATLASKALTAYSEASGVAITVESVQALAPNPTPLTDPTE